MTDPSARKDQGDPIEAPGAGNTNDSDPTRQKLESLFRLLRGSEDIVPAGPTPGDTNTVSQRFRLLRRHASGGLGDIWLAHDQVFNRVVALKEIQPQFARHQESWSRFLREALITGQLEHPGIVPIYAVGQHENGQPFYAMRFVQGETLLDGIARFHAEPAKSLDRKLQLLKLVTRLIEVCNAIAYAHSRGVIHRDIKPSNIMLGEFGETLVVDWGLAKVYVKPYAPAEISRPEPSGAESCRDTDDPSGESTRRRGTQPEPTQMGSAIGSPPYMSPEQAAGRLDELGPASDVYSLGATLFEILTGQAPIGASRSGEPRETLSVKDLLQRVQAGGFPRPSTVACGVPRALEAVCLKAMSVRPNDRYASACELASDLEAWLMGGNRGKFAFGVFESLHLASLVIAQPIFLGGVLLTVVGLATGQIPDQFSNSWSAALAALTVIACGLLTLSYWFGLWGSLENRLQDSKAAAGVRLRLQSAMTLFNQVRLPDPREEKEKKKGSLTVWGLLAFLLPLLIVWYVGPVALLNPWVTGPPLVWFYFYCDWRQPAKAQAALRWLIPLAIMTFFHYVGAGIAQDELKKKSEGRWSHSAFVVGGNLIACAYLGAVPALCFLYCSWNYYRKRRIGLIVACANLLLLVALGGFDLLSKPHEHRQYGGAILLLVLWGIVPICVIHNPGIVRNDSK